MIYSEFEKHATAKRQELIYQVEMALENKGFALTPLEPGCESRALVGLGIHPFNVVASMVKARGGGFSARLILRVGQGRSDEKEFREMSVGWAPRIPDIVAAIENYLIKLREERVAGRRRFNVAEAYKQTIKDLTATFELRKYPALWLSHDASGIALTVKLGRGDDIHDLIETILANADLKKKLGKTQ